jgi:hypothetical protein
MSTLTETLRSNLDNPVSSSEFDLHTALDKVLSGVRLSAADLHSDHTCHIFGPLIILCTQDIKLIFGS